MSKYRRKLTETERKYINDLSGRSPRAAIRLSQLLKTRSYRIGGRTVFFTPPKDRRIEIEISFKRKPIKKQKFPKMKGKGKLVWSGKN